MKVFSFELFLLGEILSKIAFSMMKNIYENVLDEEMVHLYEDVSICCM